MFKEQKNAPPPVVVQVAMFKCRCKAKFDTQEDLYEHEDKCEVVKKRFVQQQPPQAAVYTCKCSGTYTDLEKFLKHQMTCEAVQPQTAPQPVEVAQPNRIDLGCICGDQF